MEEWERCRWLPDIRPSSLDARFSLFFLPVFFYGCDRQRDRVRHGSFTQKLWRVILPFHFDLIWFFHLRITTGLKMFCINILTPSYSLGWKRRRRTLLLLWRGHVFACKYGGWTDGRNMGPARSAIKAAVYKSGSSSSSPMQIYWTGGQGLCYWLTGCELLRNVELLISRNGL